MSRAEDIKEFYALLDEEIADFDCGAQCGARNRRKLPYCCDISKTIPLMYHEEYDYVRRLRKPFIVMMPDGTLTTRFDNGGGEDWTPR